MLPLPLVVVVVVVVVVVESSWYGAKTLKGEILKMTGLIHTEHLYNLPLPSLTH